MTQAQPAAEVLGGGQRTRIGVGLIGFGWLGQAHTRSLLRIPTLFGDRPFETELMVCADNVPARLDEAVGSFGYAAGTADWRAVVEHPEVDVVYITAPNMLHLELIEAAAAAGKDIFCEKPVGGTPEQTERAAAVARDVITGVGYNYRWAPLVQYARQLIADGRLGEITNYRGRFFSMYGSDPLNPLSWRYRVEEGGHGASTDLLSHSVDLAHMLLGPIARVVGTTETFIRERPVSTSGTHYGRGSAEDPRGPVTNEDYAGMLCEFASGVRGTFEASRTIVGPESQMAFEVYGTKGALSWNLERLNELQVYLMEDELHSGYRTVYGGERFPYHGNFVPGSANGIGFEDLVVIEDFEFMRSLAERRPHSPGFEDALRFVRVQAALLESVRSGRWEEVGVISTTTLRIGVVGAGRIGSMHAELLARRVPGAAVTMIHDVLADSAREVGRALGVPVAGELDELLGAADVDAVAICTSTDTHADLIVAAAEAGKAIFCEKPVSLDLVEVDRALAAVEAAGVPFQIGFNRRFDPAHATVAAAVAQGEIGEPQLVRISSRDPAPPPVAYIRVSGGIFLDMTIHDFDMARFVTGSEVVEVYARGSVRIDPEIGDAGDVDTAVVMLEHANGCLTTIDNSRQAVYGYDQRVEVFGSAGMAASENPLAHSAIVRSEAGMRAATLPYFYLERYVPSYLREWEAFVGAVTAGETPPVTGADARAPLVIGMAAWQSLREGRPIRI